MTACLELTDILSNEISEFFFDNPVLQCMFCGVKKGGGSDMSFRFTQSFPVTRLRRT